MATRLTVEFWAHKTIIHIRLIDIHRYYFSQPLIKGKRRLQYDASEHPQG